MSRTYSQFSLPFSLPVLLKVSALAAITLLLVGCAVGAADTRVTLQDGERWKLEVQYTVTPEELASLYINEATFDQQMEAYLEAQSANYEGLCGGWQRKREGGNLVYSLSCEGEGWQRLSGLLRGQVQEVEKGKVHVTYGPVMAGRSHTFRLTGGTIESSNADEVKGGTAIWYNLVGDGQARATLTTTRKQTLPCIPAPGIALLLVPAACLVCPTRRWWSSLTMRWLSTFGR